MKNTFGSDLSLTIFGESHGRAVGAVLDGKTMAPVNMRGVDSYGMLCSGTELGLADADELMFAEVEQRPGSVRLGNAFVAGKHTIAAVVGHTAAHRREGARVRNLALAERAVDAQQQAADDKRHAPRAQIVVGRRERRHLTRTGVLHLGKQGRRAQMPVHVHILPENIGLVGITHDSFLILYDSCKKPSP